MPPNHICHYSSGHHAEHFFETIYEIRSVVQEKMLFKDLFYLELWWPLCLVEQNHLCNFGEVHHEEQFCEIILILTSGSDVI